MPNSAGVTVARINVKVSPDTSKFREELLKELKEIEKSLKGNVKVDMDADTSKAEEKLDKAARKRTAKVEVKVEDNRNWMQKLQDQAVAMRDSVNPGHQNDFYRSKLHTLIADMKKMDGMSLDSHLNPDVKLLKARWKAAFNEIEGDLKRNVKKVTIDVDVDRNTAVRAAEGTAVAAAKAAGKAAKLAGGVAGAAGDAASGFKFPTPSFGTGINPTGWAVILAGITTAAGPLVGLVSSAMLAMPGMLSMVLTPIAAVTLGMNGIAEAAEKAGLYEDKKPGKKGGGTIGAALADLKKQVTSEFANDLVQPFIKIGSIFDKITPQMTGVAKGLSDMVGGFAEAVSNNSGVERIRDTIDNIGKSFSMMQPGIQSFSSALIGLVDQFSQGMPGIAQWFNDAMAGFDQWVAKVSGDGSLKNAFSGLGEVLDSLMSTLASLGKQGIEFMGDPGNIQMTKDILDAIHTVLSDIMTVSTAIASKWDSIKAVMSGAQIFGKLASGDFLGAWDTFKGSDLGQRNDYIGTKGEVDAVTGSLKNASDAADNAKQKIAAVTQGGGLNAQRERRGFDPVSLGGVQGKVGGGAGMDTAGSAQVQQKVPPPDTSEAKAALQDYKQTAESTMNETKTAIEQATSKVNVQPPDLSQFQAAFDGVKTSAQGAVDGIASSFDGLSERVGGSAQAAADAVRNPFVELAGSMQQVGWDISAGLAAGITAGGSLAITAAVNVATQALAEAKKALDSNSPSKKFMQLGNDVSGGLAIGIDKGAGLATDQAKELAAKVSEAFASGADPTEAMKGFSSKEVNRMEKLLDHDIKGIDRQIRALDYQYKQTKDPMLKARTESLKLTKDELTAQKEILDLTNDYNGASGGGKGGDPLQESISKMMSAPGDFAKATGTQFLSDIGVKGDGMIGNAITEGIKYIFNIGSVDDAMSLMNRQNSISAISMVGR